MRANSVGRPPVHLTPAFLAIVAAGGVAGTAAREGLVLAIPDVAGFPVAIFAINIVGAFMLGALIEALTRSGPDDGTRRLIRLLLGTGFCGGFTTYSSLATASAVFLTQGSTGAAVGYGVGTVLIGGLATWGGIALGAMRRPPS